jgi:hypothetical protein
MDQSVSGGSGKPLRMTLTLNCSLRESSTMREIIASKTCSIFSHKKHKTHKKKACSVYYFCDLCAFCGWFVDSA